MPKTVAKADEQLEELLKRFKRNVNRSGVLEDVKKHRHFMNNALKRKVKSENARKKIRK
ncbi:MAG: 30S ribosomal protein S21 [Erysipelotrichaceae bacterium]|jgi:small subunit ribosomal protein S21|nr:30S ribosomal protein S21 [Erysipelotrichaceae bacterium]